MAEIKERAIDVMELWIRKHYYDIKSSYDKNEEKDEQTLKEKLIAFFEELLLGPSFSPSPSSLLATYFPPFFR